MKIINKEQYSSIFCIFGFFILNITNAEAIERITAHLNNTSDKYYNGTLVNTNYQKNERREGLISYKNFLEPWENKNISLHEKDDDTDAILLNFVNADIVNVLKYFENLFKIIFITDDALQPISPQGKSLYNSKINFSSHTPLSKKDAWNILITFLELAGVTLQPGSMYGVYRVVTLAKDSPQGYTRGPLPTFIGVDESFLPDSDMRVRFVYQVKNNTLDVIMNMIKTMQSPHSPDPIIIPEMNGVLFVDRIFNIKIILSVLKELDKMIALEEMSIIRVHNTSVAHIVDLYKSIIKDEATGAVPPKVAGSKRTDLVTYFDPQVRLIPDVRNNLIIALGFKEGLQKVEDFIRNFQDIVPKTNYLPIHKYLLKYTQAEVVAQIIKQALGFKSDSDAGKYNGIRNGEKYLADIFILPEPNTNSLLISCSHENYAYVYNLLNTIDVEPAQVSMNIIILSVEEEDLRQLGTQLRNGPNDKNINWQTGLLDKNVGVVGNYQKNADSGSKRLLGNLLNLVTGASGQAGATIISLGQDEYGVWGIVKMLMQKTKAKIINNPFLVITNKYEGFITVGETRRIAATTITNANNEQNSYNNDEAALNIKMTVDINDLDKVFLNLDLSNSIFTAPEGNAISAGNKTTRSVNTTVLLDNNEVVAISGLMIDYASEVGTTVPWISKIPLLGALFSNEQKQNRRSMLLVFIQPEILRCPDQVQKHTNLICERITNMNKIIKEKKISCPLRKAFFEFDKYEQIDLIKNNIFGTLFPSCSLLSQKNNKAIGANKDKKSLDNNGHKKKNRLGCRQRKDKSRAKVEQ
jgi:type II secretory pathway component GspD/PulD (secretin)